MRTLTVVAVSLLAVSSVEAADITACGQEVPSGEIGLVQTDLVCGGPYAVSLRNRSVLDLQGHSITSVDADGIRCDDFRPSYRCTVTSSGSPGTLVGEGGHVGIGAFQLNVNNVAINGFDVAWLGHSWTGPARGRVRASGVTLTQNGTAMSYWRHAVLENSTVSDNGVGIDADKSVKVTNVTASNNYLTGVSGKRIRGDALTALGNGATHPADRVPGVSANRVLLSNSTVTGSSVDIVSRRRPVLVATACDRSTGLPRIPDLQPWGVCALD